MNEYQAYFLVSDFSADGKPIVDGIIPENAWNCGSCDRGQVYFVAWYKDGPVEDQDPHHATIVDFSLEAVDQRMQTPLVQAILSGEQLPDATLPTVRYLIESDRAEGLSGDQILDRRGGILGDTFLGFTFDSVLAENPWIVQPVKGEEGSEHPNIWRCNLGPMVES